jgi:PDDEXK-like domain of unknown function (DUF3799)
MQRIDWPPERYHADRTAVSKSWLDWIHRSPAHLKAYLDGLIPSTPRQEFGTLVHSFVLEPDSITSRYLPVPKLDRRTKSGKERYAELEAEAAARGLIMIDDETWIKAMAIKDSVYRHRTAAALLGKGEPEQSVLWTNPDTGEQCKARADFLREHSIVDLKTTYDASPDAFAKSMVNWRYPVQAAHYLEGFSASRFIWIATEIEEPFGVAVYVDNPEILGLGKAQRDPDLALYAVCKFRNEWPGYPTGVQDLKLPRWALSDTSRPEFGL